jgi:hypothetical protein
MKITNEQKSFLDKVVTGKWSINPNTGLIDVEGSVYMSDMKLTEIPIKFGEVTGYFNCYENELTSLVGAPQSVGKDFYCSYNQLTSLKGAPQSVEKDFICHHNRLTSLVGAPQSVGGLFYIDLSYIDKKYYHVIIPEIEELISRGINLYKPDEYYYPYKESYYNNKIIKIL